MFWAASLDASRGQLWSVPYYFFDTSDFLKPIGFPDGSSLSLSDFRLPGFAEGGTIQGPIAYASVSGNVTPRDYNYLVNGNKNGILSSISKDGIVDFKINAVNSPIRGTELFDNMMGAYGDDVTAIRGNWMSTVDSPNNKNLGVVNSLTALGVPLEDAVTQTWTAQQAARYGFTNSTVQVVVGEPGSYTKVETLFTKK